MAKKSSQRPGHLFNGLKAFAGAMGLLFFQGAAGQAETYQQAQYIMGTVFEITLDSARPLQEQERDMLFAPLFAQIRAHDQHLSNYRQDSELSRIVKQWKVKPQPLEVSSLLCGALSRAADYHEVTSGAFDITVGPLVQLWGFKDHTFRVPSTAEITQTLQYTGFRGLEFDASRCLIQRLPPVENPLDFGAMGKGMAIDAAIAYLNTELKPLHASLSGLAIHGGGSSAYFWGAPTATPQGWPIMPRQGSKVYWLKNQGLGVSGLKENHGIYKGRLYGHIIDPRSGQALSGKAQLQRGDVYVVAERAEVADVFSTTLWVVDALQAEQLAKDFNFRFWWERSSSVGP
jgi:FAD:protein FMN transferase